MMSTPAKILEFKRPQKHSNKFNFTMKRLTELVPPVAGCRYVYDSNTSGLALRVTKSGVKTYLLARRLNGKPVRLRLGDFHSMSLRQAREAVMQINGNVAAGRDIIRERAAARQQGVKLSELFSAWEKSARTRKLRTVDKDKRLWEIHIPRRMAEKSVTSISSQDVQALVDKIGAKHPRTANKVVALLSRVINRGVKLGLVESTNIMKVVDRFPEDSRERFMKPDELSNFLDAVQQEQEPWRGYFLMLLYTGGRRSAVAAMRWSDLDFNSCTWHVPSWESKNKKPLAVPLVPEAICLLEMLRENKLNEWVFPSTSRTGHVTTPTKVWGRICKRAGLKDLRIHDIRRTVGSWLASTGSNQYIISKALGHLSSRSAEVYARLDTSAVRAALSGITKNWG